jgi:hypothetical protein
MKMCSWCLVDKPLEEFYVRADGRKAGNLSSWCKRCIGDKSRERCLLLPGDQMIRAAKHRAKKSGLPYDLDGHKLVLTDRLNRGCEVSGVPFQITGPRDWNSPSIDRIRPELGYVYSNVRIIIWCLNSLFGYWGEENAATAAKAWLAKKEK